MPRFILALAALLAIAVSPAEAERRLALVIGNDSYHEVTPLQKAVSDAESMAEKLLGSASRSPRSPTRTGAT